MEISKIEISNFGKLKDYTLDFSNGFQVIYGENEDGKSTILAFIEMMFYGDQGNRNVFDGNSRQKYSPWDGSNIKGSMEFNHNDTLYRVEKTISGTYSTDKVNLRNLNINSKVRLAKNQEIGNHFFGIDLEGFRRSSFISQIGKIEVSSKTDMIKEKLLSNVAETGDENFSHQQIEDKLNNAKYKLRSKNSKNGLLPDIDEKLNQLYLEYEDENEKLHNQKDFQEEYNLLEKKQRERDQITKELSLYNDSIKKANIEKLLKTSNELDKIKKDIVNSKYPYDKIHSFLNTLEKDINQHKKTQEELNHYKKTITNLGDTPITDDDYKNFQNVLSTNTHTKKLLEFYDDKVINSFIDYSTAKNKYNEENNVYIEKDRSLKELQPKKDKLISLKSDYKDMEKNLLKCNESLNIQNAALIEQKSQNKHISDLKTPANVKDSNKLNQNPILIIVGLIIILLSLLGGIIISSFTYVAIILGIFIVVLGLKSNPKVENQIEDIEQKSNIMTNEDTSIEDNLKIEIKKKESEIADIKSSMKKIVLEIQELSHIKDQYDEIETSVNKLKIELDFLLNRKEEQSVNLDKDKKQFIEKLYTSDKAFDNIAKDDEFDYNKIKTELSNILNSSDKNIKTILKDKNVEDIEEFEIKHRDYVSNMKNRNSIKNLNSSIEKMEISFINKVNDYKPVNNYNTAINIYSDLETNYKNAKTLEQSIKITVDSVDIKFQSTEDLKRILSNISDETTSLSSDDYAEYKEQLNQLPTSEDISENMKSLASKLHPLKRNLEQIQSEIANFEEEKKTISSYYESLEIASETMKKAQDKMRESFAPILDQKTSRFFSSITDGKYNDIIVNNDYEIEVKSLSGFEKSGYYSSGTVEQVYLSLRLAISELISDDKTTSPLLLDDVLIQYDDKRTELAMKFLDNYSKTNDLQIILFSCHNRIVELGKHLNIRTSSV